MDAFFSIYLFFIPGNSVPQWDSAGQKIGAMEPEDLEDLIEYFGDVDSVQELLKEHHVNITDEVFQEMLSKLHMDLVNFRVAIEEAERSGGDLLVRKTMPDGQRIFAVAGYSVDDTPMHSYEWMVSRLAESGIMQAAGFKLII